MTTDGADRYMSLETKELVMYTRTTPCPFVSLAKRVLDANGVRYRELYIDQNKTYEQRVLHWTGFHSVPTLVVANLNEELPYTDPTPLPRDSSPRGINRGSMITEPGEEQLLEWLRQHHFLTAADTVG